MYKLGHLVSGNWVEHIYPATFSLSESTQGTQRLIAGVPDGRPEVFRPLVESLAPPYNLLYILHTPRGEEPAGRYQSSPIDTEEFRRFIAQFSSYLSSDARFDIWAHSSSENATIVWDRHNQIFGYGPLQRYARTLNELGFAQGEVEVPAPHAHNYRSDCDPDAALVLQAFDWSFSPLREEDEQ